MLPAPLQLPSQPDKTETASQSGLSVRDAPPICAVNEISFPTKVNIHYSALEINFSFVHYNLRLLLCGVHFHSCLGPLLLIDHSPSNLGLLTVVVNFESNFKVLLLAVHLGSNLEPVMVEGLFSDAADQSSRTEKAVRLYVTATEKKPERD